MQRYHHAKRSSLLSMAIDSKWLLSSASTACETCIKEEAGIGDALKKLPCDVFAFFRGGLGGSFVWASGSVELLSWNREQDTGKVNILD